MLTSQSDLHFSWRRRMILIWLLMIHWLTFAADGHRAAAADDANNASKKPNIIVVFIDDMGWSDLSCFGGQSVKSVHIDRLASEGLRFHNFYVNSPICSPSRTALTTGNYPARHRITSYLANRKENNDRQIAQWLDVHAPTLARMLSARGYATGHFGKWHMGGQRNVGEAPLITEYGFDASLTNFEGLGPRVLPINDPRDGTEPQRYSLGSDKLGRGPIEWADRSLVTEKFVTRTVEFIDQAAAKGQPFYVNVWPDDVHSPFFPPEGRKSDEVKRALYHRVLVNMDRQLGALFDRIRGDDKLRDNTLILLASDNGPEPGAGSALPLRGSKGELWEGGIRSPLIVWWPGRMRQDVVGSVNDSAILSSVDLMRSIIDIAGATPPQDYQSDGQVVVQALTGNSSQARSEPLFWRRPPDRPSQPNNRRPDLAVRDGQWKLVCDLDGGHPELYNLVADQSEQHDLAGEQTSVVKRLTESVVKWNATLPKDGTSASR